MPSLYDRLSIYELSYLFTDSTIQLSWYLYGRKRIYIIAVRLDGAVTSTDPAPFFDMVGRMLDAFKIGSLSVKSVLLADDDPYLLAELQRRKQHRQDQESRIKKGEISKEYFLSFVYLYALVFSLCH